MGEVVTFYSYKGGTGRTMALANVAWILAAAGHRVLIVDWDLEAPGLHRYFHPFLRDKELITSAGVIDLVIDFAVQATTPASTDRENDATWYLPLADVLRYAVSLDVDFGSGQLDLLPAGQQTPAYATRVNSFNWDNFYERLGGGTFLEAVRASMLREYDYVLIDSRTGVSDTSGICTVQMPDKVVVCFTLNRQSIEGAAAVARSIVEARRKAGRPPTPIFPVPTRVEKAEALKLDAARAVSRARFDEFLWHVEAGTSRTRYWDEIEMPYQAYYAYEEVLAVFRDPSSQVGTVRHAMEQLAARLTNRPSIEWTMPPGAVPATVLDQWGWTPSVPPSPSQTAASPSASVTTNVNATPASPRVGGVQDSRSRHWVYISYAGDDIDSFFDRFVSDLDQAVRVQTGESDRVAYIDREITLTDDVRQGTLRAISRSRTALCLVSPTYVYSEWCGREFSLFLQQHIPILPVLWVPLQGDWPAAMRSPQIVDAGTPPRVMRSGLRALMRLDRYRDAYEECVEAFASRIVELGRQASERPPVAITRWSDVPNAFTDEAPSLSAAGSPLAFASLAPTAREAANVGAPADRHGASELDWRPFGRETAVALVQRAAAAEQLRVETIEVSESLPDQLRQFETARRFALVLVDADSLRVPRLSRILEGIGTMRLASTRVIVVLEPGASSERSSILKMIQETSASYVVARSHEGDDDLTTAIRGELVRLRSELIREVALRPPPSSPPEPPGIL